MNNQTVCCMCGDVGFPEKLFRCSNCRNRFQHSYCSNYCGESDDPNGICDWCHCELGARHANGERSAYSGGGKTAKQQRQHREEAGSPAAGKSRTRRYKLLKDVMC